jgi:hypothetical protein
LYDVVVDLGAKRCDVSTGRVAARFTLPMFDGRIFLPTDEAPTVAADIAPRLSCTPPSTLRAVKLDRGMTVIQTPGGLDLRFEATGALRNILWRGKTLMTGGWPIVASPPFTHFRAENVSFVPTEMESEVRLAYRGTLVESDQRVDFVETCIVRPGNRFTLHFDFAALTDLNLRMWRHYFMFPVARYASAVARSGDKAITLPAAFKEIELLRELSRAIIESQDASITIESSVPMTLVDHRKWDTNDYLLAAYPVHGAVKQGMKWAAEISVTVSAPK